MTVELGNFYYYFRIIRSSSLAGVLLADGCRNWQGSPRGVCVQVSHQLC